ncbi:dehydrodolichyl diphosphate synthase 2-like [Senna tora]|uniref:Alkyl transferase n=1 Tax=Senna tora TaxID=362788 RepID=A0A834WAE0_9FABA|nr:dehydrodolichyl diphosphate synthase 2-like [Senna tora]
MFSLRLPIPLENTLTPLPGLHTPPSCLRSQTHRFPSLPLIPNPKLRTTLPPPNAAVREESEAFPAGLRSELMPKHVAVIMDGNRRWAKMRGLSASAGHEAGLRSFWRLTELCCGWGIKVLTVFWFSTQNWVRPEEEVDFLMSLFERTMNEIEAFARKGIRISMIGEQSKLPCSLQRMMKKAEERTKENSGLHLIIAVSYSGKYDVVQACKSVAEKVKNGVVEVEDISESLIEQELETKCTEFPYPDLLIRTSGELRLSNFLLWQLAYTELYFDPQLWPDFGKQDLLQALVSFQHRHRRYGATHS